MKVNVIFAKAQLLNISAQFYTTANINSYLLYISQFTSDVISKTVSLHKLSDRAALWWLDKIYQAVNSAHQLHWQAERFWTKASYDHLKTSCKICDKLIAHIKYKTFWEAVHQAVVNSKIWLLTQWARGKKKRYLSVPSLCTNCNADPTTYKFIKKVNRLRNAFFLQTQADLSDILDKKTLMPHMNF